MLFVKVCPDEKSALFLCLNNIVADIENKFSKEFDESDSVYVFQLNASCKVQKYGYAAHEDDELLILN